MGSSLSDSAAGVTVASVELDLDVALGCVLEATEGNEEMVPSLS